MILLCSCSSYDDPYDNIDICMIAMEDEIILKELRHSGKVSLDSAWLESFETNDDGTAQMKFGVQYLPVSMSDSVLLIRRDGLVWAFWCKHWIAAPTKPKRVMDLNQWNAELTDDWDSARILRSPNE